jgi:hypothetical protein
LYRIEFFTERKVTVNIQPWWHDGNDTFKNKFSGPTHSSLPGAQNVTHFQQLHSLLSIIVFTRAPGRLPLQLRSFVQLAHTVPGIGSALQRIHCLSALPLLPPWSAAVKVLMLLLLLLLLLLLFCSLPAADPTLPWYTAHARWDACACACC